MPNNDKFAFDWRMPANVKKKTKARKEIKTANNEDWQWAKNLTREAHNKSLVY